MNSGKRQDGCSQEWERRWLWTGRRVRISSDNRYLSVIARRRGRPGCRGLPHRNPANPFHCRALAKKTANGSGRSCDGSRDDNPFRYSFRKALEPLRVRVGPGEVGELLIARPFRI